MDTVFLQHDCLSMRLLQLFLGHLLFPFLFFLSSDSLPLLHQPFLPIFLRLNRGLFFNHWLFLLWFLFRLLLWFFFYWGFFNLFFWSFLDFPRLFHRRQWSKTCRQVSSPSSCSTGFSYRSRLWSCHYNRWLNWSLHRCWWNFDLFLRFFKVMRLLVFRFCLHLWLWLRYIVDSFFLSNFLLKFLDQFAILGLKLRHFKNLPELLFFLLFDLPETFLLSDNRLLQDVVLFFGSLLLWPFSLHSLNGLGLKSFVSIDHQMFKLHKVISQHQLVEYLLVLGVEPLIK